MRNLVVFFTLTLLCSSCSKWIIPDAIKNSKPILMEVQPIGDASINPDRIYKVEVIKQGEEYELVVTRPNGTTTYHLPPNKLNLLSQLEANLKDLKAVDPTYTELTIASEHKKKKFRINTDIISDFIGGLKKKSN